MRSFYIISYRNIGTITRVVGIHRSMISTEGPFREKSSLNFGISMKRVWIMIHVLFFGLHGKCLPMQVEENGKVWILFRNKGHIGMEKPFRLESALEIGLTEKALLRRGIVPVCLQELLTGYFNFSEDLSDETKKINTYYCCNNISFFII